MNRVPTIILKLAVVFIGLVILAICIFFLPAFANGVSRLMPELAYLKYPFLACMYAASISFLFSLYETFKFLSYIEKDNAFSELSLKSLNKIKISNIIVSIILYLTGMPVIFLIADLDDAPGLIFFGLIFASVPLIIATSVVVLHKLFKKLKPF